MPAIAITDYENMYGIIEFYKTAKANGIKPILGVELNFTQNIKLQSIQKNLDSSYIVLLAKNYE
jgi:DNA polymerase-3 subunit alpha